MVVKQRRLIVLTVDSVWLGPRGSSTLQRGADPLTTKAGHNVIVSERLRRPTVSWQRYANVQPLSQVPTANDAPCSVSRYEYNLAEAEKILY